MPGLNNYATSLGIKKNPTDLSAGSITPPDPTKALTTGQTTATAVNNNNLTNPGQALTGLGSQYQAAIGNKLADPNASTTQFGQVADKNLMNEANSGQLYGVANKSAQTQRANAQNTSQQQGQTQSNLASQGIMPGTAAYQRALGATNANVAGQNLNRTQDLNNYEMNASKDINNRLNQREATGYSQNQTALGQAAGVESNAQGKQNTATQNAFSQEQNAKQGAQTQYNQQQTNRLENLNKSTALVNAATDPREKAILQGVLNNGGDVQAAYNSLHGITPDQTGNLNLQGAGTLNANAASQNPSQVEKTGLTEQAKAYNPQNPGESDQAYQSRIDAMVNKQGNQIFTSANAPLDTQEQQRTDTGIQQKINTLPAGGKLSDADFQTAIKDGVVKQYTAATIPKGADVTTFLKDNPSGLINYGGKQYRVTGGDHATTSFSTTGQERHTDSAVVTDEQGNTKYIYDGTVHDDKPKHLNQSDYWALPGF